MDDLDDLILDLLEWIGPDARPYSEVLEAWRTSCPRLPVWESAVDRGYVERIHHPGHGRFVGVSSPGAAHLRSCRPDVRDSVTSLTH
jgi:hypothetical protein